MKILNNYWYSSRANEIFIDTDNFHRSIAHTCSRLMGAIKCGRLRVKEIEYHKSRSENHIHTLITLKEEMDDISRYVWAIILHSDLYRGCSTIMRSRSGISNPDIFITPKRFQRVEDDYCDCEQKHSAEVLLTCPAAIRMRGNDRVKGMFGLPEKGFTLEQISEFVKNQSLDLF